jgi:hypothetical protein
MSESTTIYLSDKAFMGIILSSVEVYRNECLGALLGYKTRGMIVVEYAIPFQSAERTPSEVTPNWRRELKVMEVIPKLIQLEKLGYFHSHPQWRNNEGVANLSKCDKMSMDKVEIEIVVAINDAKKKMTWNNSKMGIYGTLGKYRFNICAFYKKLDGTIKQYRILCPYAVGFDYAFELE